MTRPFIDPLLHRLLIAASLIVGAVGARAGRSHAPEAAHDPAETSRLAEEIEQNLRSQILAMWFPRAVDPSGGFYQNFGEDWSRSAGSEKGIVYHARMIWVAAETALRNPDQRHTYREYVRHGMKMLGQRLRDKEQGGFYWSLDDSGAPARDGEKHAYGISFAIYACASAFRATHDESDRDLAKDAYRWLETHAHDAKNGGYYEAFARSGLPILVPLPESPEDPIGTRYGHKSMNTHIHLLESLTALYEIWPNPGLRKRLEEVFGIVRDRIAVEKVGCLNYYFTPDWRALPDHDSFGHDVETAYLLVEAAAALGRPDDKRTWKLARRIVDHALDFGWDSQFGGFYDTGRVFGTPFATEKIWWVQAEGLNALMLMDTRFGHETARYWDAFLRQWEFIRDHQVDKEHGGWHATVTRNGAGIPGRAKSDSWTDPYHQARALMHVAKMLRSLRL